MKILEKRNNNGRNPVYHQGGIEGSVRLGDNTPPAPVSRKLDEHIEINRQKWYRAKRPYNQGVIPNGSGPTGLGSALTPDTLHYLGPRMYFLERFVKALFLGGCVAGFVGAAAVTVVWARSQSGIHPVANIIAFPDDKQMAFADDKQIGVLADILSDESNPAGMYMMNSAWAAKEVEIKRLIRTIKGSSMDPLETYTGFFSGVAASANTDDGVAEAQVRKNLAALQKEIKRIPEFIPIGSTADGQANTEELVRCGYLQNTTNGPIDFTNSSQTTKLESLGLIVYKNK